MTTAPEQNESLPLDAQERVLKIHLGILIAIATILGVFAIRSLYMVLMPAVFAFFLAVLLRPLQSWVARRVPWKLRWLGVFAAVLAFFIVVAAVLASIWLSAEIVSQKGPQYTSAVKGLQQQVVTWLEQHNVPVPESFQNTQGRVPGHATTMATRILHSVWMFVAYAVVVFFLMLLFLLEAHEWTRKSMEAFFGRRTERIRTAVSAVAVKLRRYFYVRTGISFFSAVIEGLWIWVLGIDFAFVWGMLFFVLNFVPNIGSIVAAIPPILLAFVQFGPSRALALAVGLLAIEQLIGNFIDPRVQGATMQISPAVVLVSIIFWTWAWGVPGAFLAVPITIALMMVFSQIESLQPLAIMLSRPGNDEILKRPE